MLVRYKGDDGRTHWHRLTPMMLYLEPTEKRVSDNSWNKKHIEEFYKTIQAEYGTYTIGVDKVNGVNCYGKDYDYMQITINGEEEAVFDIARVGRKNVLRIGYISYNCNKPIAFVYPQEFNEAFGFTLA
jgi:hypothetical protein